MKLVFLGLIVWGCGLLYEMSCVGFVHWTTKSSPVMTALMSMAGAAAGLSGVLGSVHDIHIAPFYVAGIGSGAFIGVLLKKRHAVVVREDDLELERLADDVERVLELRRSRR